MMSDMSDSVGRGDPDTPRVYANTDILHGAILTIGQSVAAPYDYLCIFTTKIRYGASLVPRGEFCLTSDVLYKSPPGRGGTR